MNNATPKAEFPEIYLGDGLYAQYHGYDLQLRAPRNEGDHSVFLEPRMLAALIQYAKDVGMLS